MAKYPRLAVTARTDLKKLDTLTRPAATCASIGEFKRETVPPTVS